MSETLAVVSEYMDIVTELLKKIKDLKFENKLLKDKYDQEVRVNRRLRHLMRDTSYTI